MICVKTRPRPEPLPKREHRLPQFGEMDALRFAPRGAANENGAAVATATQRLSNDAALPAFSAGERAVVNSVPLNPSSFLTGATRTALVVTACIAWLFPAISAAAAIPPAEQILPADTLLVITAPDCVKVRAVFKKSSPSQFWNDPAMRPFREKFLAKWNEEFVAPLERDLGVKFDDYGALFQGQCTFAITQEGWSAQSDDAPAVLFLLDARDKSDQLKKNLAALRKKWTDDGKALKTEKIRNVEFLVVALTTNDVPKTLKQLFPQRQPVRELGKEDEKPAAKTELVIGQYESLLIVGTSSKAVEKVVARLTGGAASALADSAAFEADRLARFRESSLFGWLNARVVCEVLARVPEDKPNPQAPNPLPPVHLVKAIGVTGLSGLKTVAFNVRVLGEGTLTELFFGAPEASREGVFKILATEPKDASPPAFVPADAVKFQRWRIDDQKALATLEKMVKDISPQLFNTWNFLLSSGNEAAKQDDPEYDVRKNLFGNLGDDLITYETAPRDTAPGAAGSSPSLWLLGSPAPDKLAAALKGMLVILSPQATSPETREFLGRKIFSVKLPAQAGTDAGKPRNLMYAASGGYVALSTDAAMLEEFLRSSESQAKTLRETPGLTDAAQKVGGQSTGWFAYENQNETTRLLFASLRASAGEPTNNIPGAGANPLMNSLPFAGPQKDFKDWMDFSLLPDFERVSKYFTFSVHAGSANVDGITFKFFSPAPPPVKK